MDESPRNPRYPSLSRLPPEKRPKLPYLRAVEDGSEHPLRWDVTTVGSGSGCDVIVEHDAVAPVHAEITQRGSGRYFVADMGSASGTFVNGRRIRRRARIRNGDKAGFGPAQFVFIDTMYESSRARRSLSPALLISLMVLPLFVLGFPLYQITHGATARALSGTVSSIRLQLLGYLLLAVGFLLEAVGMASSRRHAAESDENEWSNLGKPPGRRRGRNNLYRASRSFYPRPWLRGSKWERGMIALGGALTVLGLAVVLGSV